MLLVEWGKSLDKIAGDAGDADSAVGDQEDEDGEGTSLRSDTVRDWKGLLDLLLLDHSAAEAEGSQEGGSMKGQGWVNGKTHNPDSVVHEAWWLEEVEESILLEVLIASIRRAKWEAANLTDTNINESRFVSRDADDDQLFQSILLDNIRRRLGHFGGGSHCIWRCLIVLTVSQHKSAIASLRRGGWFSV
ncbi:hypothetical protein Hypma_009890 [Hypsizygus marmoreus]|uniref:Uncharacterized protein n=1 Tax=Hypsizygus marmoreus TaxID=39966 RepID=A0A369JNZ9_HYPMA|nr:hypothetical protein Hypma_009890 [Hypsizygus marmoreus]